MKLPKVEIKGNDAYITGNEEALRALGEALILKSKHKENLKIAIRATDKIIKIFYEE